MYKAYNQGRLVILHRMPCDSEKPHTAERVFCVARCSYSAENKAAGGSLPHK